LHWRIANDAVNYNKILQQIFFIIF